MKTKFLVLSVFAIGLVSLLSSFNSASESCSITVSTLLNGAPVSEVLVGLSASEDDRDESVYIFEEETMSNGKVTFKGLAAGTYYLDAFVDSNGADFWAEATVSVTSGTTEVTMKLTEANYEEEED